MTIRPIFTEEHEAFRAVVRRFVAKEIEPFAGQWDEDGEFPRDLYRKAADIGWKPAQYLNNVSASVGSVMKPAGFENAVGIITSTYLLGADDPAGVLGPAGLDADPRFLARVYDALVPGATLVVTDEALRRAPALTVIEAGGENPPARPHPGGQ